MNVCSMHKVLHLSHCFKTPKICDKNVEKDSLILKFVLDSFKTQGMLLKSLLAIIHVPDQHKTQQMCENPFWKNPEMLQFIPNRYKTQKMCRNAVDSHALE